MLSRRPHGLTRGLRGHLLAMTLGLGAAVGLVASCGARTGLPVPTVGEGGGGGMPEAGPDVAPDVPPDVPIDVPQPFDCAEAGITYIYLVTEENDLLAFYPPTNATTLIGHLDCPFEGGNAFSMGVSRSGVAYVVFEGGNLYRVSTKNAACEETPFIPNQDGFALFGMGYSSDTSDPDEHLYVAEINFNGPSKGLATIDTTTYQLKPIAPFSENPGDAIEMTGTGDGRLFGYFLNAADGGTGVGGTIVEIDKSNADILSKIPVQAGVQLSDLAFAFWGGDFFIFNAVQGSGVTSVTRYRPRDGTTMVVATIAGGVVGAGVSTCAPVE